MKRNPLNAVLTQRESVRDRERMALGKLLAEDAKIGSKIDEYLADQMRQLAKVADLTREGRVDVQAVMSRRYYAGQLRAELLMLNAAREELGQEIAEQRGKLAQADAAVKAVENLLAKRAEQARIEAERRTQLQVEDQWAASQASKSA